MLAGARRALRAGHGPVRAGDPAAGLGLARVAARAGSCSAAWSCRPSCWCRWSPTGWSPASGSCRCRAARRRASRPCGRQWVWTFRYPDHGGAETKGVLHLPAGAPVDIVVTSRDVIHAFWIPRLAGKIDAVPGHVERAAPAGRQPGPLRRASAPSSAASATPGCGSTSSCIRAEDFAAALAQAAPGDEKMSAPPTSAAGQPRAAAAPRARRDLGHRAGAAAPRRGQPFRHRPAHHGHGVRVLRDRRRARHADARAARHARRRVHGPGDLQPGLHRCTAR